MKLKPLILTLVLALTAGGTVAAIKYGHVEQAKVTAASESNAGAIPRVVVTASRAQVRALLESDAAAVPFVE